MISPQYTQALDKSIFKDNAGKWYCSYCEEREGISSHRYLWPEGWAKIAYYWNSKEEAEIAYRNAGMNGLPISQQEFEECKIDKLLLEKMEEEDWKRDYRQ